MKAKIILGMQLVAGIMLLLFGVMKFVQIAPPMHMAPAMEAYKMALADTGFMMKFIGLIEVLAGISFIVDKYVSLTAIAALTIMINAFLAHLFLDPFTITPSIILFVLIVVAMVRHKEDYEPLLKTK